MLKCHIYILIFFLLNTHERLKGVPMLTIISIEVLRREIQGQYSSNIIEALFDEHLEYPTIKL